MSFGRFLRATFRQGRICFGGTDAWRVFKVLLGTLTYFEQRMNEMAIIIFVEEISESDLQANVCTGAIFVRFLMNAVQPQFKFWFIKAVWQSSSLAVFCAKEQKMRCNYFQM